MKINDIYLFFKRENLTGSSDLPSAVATAAALASEVETDGNAKTTDKHSTTTNNNLVNIMITTIQVLQLSLNNI